MPDRLLLSHLPRCNRHLLGVTLFERNRRGTVTTSMGEYILRQVRHIIEDARYLRALTDDLTDLPEGELRIGLAYPPLHSKPALLLRSWSNSYPQTRISLHTSSDRDIVFTLPNRHIDAAIIPQFALDNSLASSPLHREHIVVVLPYDHPLANQETLSIRNLTKEGLLVPSKADGDWYRYFYLAQIGSQTHIPMHYEGILTLLSQIRVGLNITLCNAACQEFQPCGVVFRPLDDPNAEFDVHLVWRAEAEDAILGRFVAFMRNLTQKRGKLPSV
ncbi:LysR family substrate-binding domain-containing protein, partial [Komagataeibacter intermedius]|uniref:LysR family substrate-binding domain-containing protein n=1 Tax=Komagataeibacter intermedius TaxID=66229 RepID=UPI001F1DFF18